MKRKGQAALEFLMTYGWAILAAIVVIALLAIYVRPGSLRPDVTLIEPPFTDAEAQVSAAGGLSLSIPNNAGAAIEISNVAFSVTSPSEAACPPDTTLTALTAGQRMTATSACTGLTAGDSFTTDVSITYIEADGVFNKTATGSITYEVLA